MIKILFILIDVQIASKMINCERWNVVHIVYTNYNILKEPTAV
jgi:hypothetical protein